MYARPNSLFVFIFLLVLALSYLRTLRIPASCVLPLLLPFFCVPTSSFCQLL